MSNRNKNPLQPNYPDEKEMSGCAISGIMSETGECFGGGEIIDSIANMHERSNGLGGGFAAYGIYPERKEHYALHLMCADEEARRAAAEVLEQRCVVHDEEPIPIRPLDSITNRPLLHRFFVDVTEKEMEKNYELDEEDVMVQIVMEINTEIEDAYVFSSGKNMGIFKGVGYPEDIGRFYRLDEYEAYIWTAHGRFPTNTTGWWGGAHPFGLLDWSVVHNGEISSYGINRRYLANFDYNCTLHTDTEVVAYLFDLLLRKHNLPVEVACMAMAPPFWTEVERMPEEQQKLARAVRQVYGGALLNGPFSVVVANGDGIIAFNDRMKLRPMTAARRGDRLYVASEEAAIRVVCPAPDELWYAKGGEPIVGKLKGEDHDKQRREKQTAEKEMAR